MGGDERRGTAATDWAVAMPDPGETAATILALLRWVGDNPFQTAVALAILTVFATPLRQLLRALRWTLRIPQRFADSELAPTIETTKPPEWVAFVRLCIGATNLLLVRPTREATQPFQRLYRVALGVRRWPLGPVSERALSVVDPLAKEVDEYLQRVAVSARQARDSAVTELQGAKQRWPMWRMTGGLVLFAGLLLFLWADFGISVATHFEAIGAEISGIPPQLLLVVAQYAVASVVTAVMLGLVLGDLSGMTHFGPWEELSAGQRRVLAVAVALVFVLALLVSLALALWRADQVLKEQWLPIEWRRFLVGTALALPVPMMLIATALIGWAAPQFLAIVWLVSCALAAILASALSVVIRAVASLLPWASGVLELLLRLVGVFVVAVGLLVAFLGLAAVVIAGLGASAFSVLAAGVSYGAWRLLAVAGWLALSALRLQGLVSDGAVFVLVGLLYVLMYPWAQVWNYAVESRYGKRLGLGKIPYESELWLELDRPLAQDDAVGSPTRERAA